MRRVQPLRPSCSGTGCEVMLPIDAPYPPADEENREKTSHGNWQRYGGAHPAARESTRLPFASIATGVPSWVGKYPPLSCRSRITMSAIPDESQYGVFLRSSNEPGSMLQRILPNLYRPNSGGSPRPVSPRPKASGRALPYRDGDAIFARFSTDA